MRILGVDPGSKTTGWALYDSDKKEVVNSGEFPGDEWESLEQEVDLEWQRNQVVVERPRAYGAARPDLVETAIIAGRLFGNFEEYGIPRWMTRKEICDELGAAVHQKALRDDKAVRAVLIELHGEGSHKKGGALAGVKGHAWAALAAAVAWALKQEEK